MNYYAIRFRSAPDQIRIERAATPQAAHRLAFGSYTRMTRWEWKDMGTRISVIQSDRKRIALLVEPENWNQEGPSNDSDSE